MEVVELPPNRAPLWLSARDPELLGGLLGLGPSPILTL